MILRREVNMMNYNKFFDRSSDKVAKDLLGRFIVRDTGNGILSAKIIETGAYEGGKETPSRKGMKYSSGRIFLMPFRGSKLLNITTDKPGYPSCVEIRKLIFDDEIINGSGSVSKFLKISDDLEGTLLGKELQISNKKIRKSEFLRSYSDGDNCLGYFSLKI